MLRDVVGCCFRAGVGPRVSANISAQKSRDFYFMSPGIFMRSLATTLRFCGVVVDAPKGGTH